MLDQSYSVSNLQTILALENRKGSYKEQEFFEVIFRLDGSIRSKRRKYRELKAAHQRLKARYRRTKKKALESKLKRTLLKMKLLAKNQGRLKKLRSEKLLEELRVLSEQLSSKPNPPALVKIDSLSDGKPGYRLDNSVTTYFQDKQVQSNLKSCFGVRAKSRDEVIAQVSNSLSDKFPKVLVRTDISQFYESLSHSKIRASLGSRIALDPTSRRIVFDVIDQYARLSGAESGVPRGVGISALVSEIYMRDFDRTIEGRDDVLFYVRYVDDLFILFKGQPSLLPVAHYINVVESIAADSGLRLNSAKTHSVELPSKTEFDFLGYKFVTSKSALPPTLRMTDKRFERYKRRIDLMLSDYCYQAMRDERRARKLLLNRVRYLTANTHLQNNKRDAMVGVYFGNRHATTADQFGSLDTYLHGKAGVINDPDLVKKVQAHSFEHGFVTKRYVKLSTQKIGEIVKVWKYVT